MGYIVHRVQRVRCDLVTKQQQQEISNIIIPGRQKLSNKYAIYLNLSIYLSTYIIIIIINVIFIIQHPQKQQEEK